MDTQNVIVQLPPGLYSQLIELANEAQIDPVEVITAWLPRLTNGGPGKATWTHCANKLTRMAGFCQGIPGTK